MKTHEDVKKLVVAKLGVFNARNFYPTANELYRSISREDAKFSYKIRTVKSFSKIIQIFPEVSPVKRSVGAPWKYKVSDRLVK